MNSSHVLPAARSGCLLTKPDGSTVLLFDAKRAHGLAGHFGWSLRVLTAIEVAAHIRATVPQSLSR